MSVEVPAATSARESAAAADADAAHASPALSSAQRVDQPPATTEAAAEAAPAVTARGKKRRNEDDDAALECESSAYESDATISTSTTQSSAAAQHVDHERASEQAAAGAERPVEWYITSMPEMQPFVAPRTHQAFTSLHDARMWVLRYASWLGFSVVRATIERSDDVVKRLTLMCMCSGKSRSRVQARQRALAAAAAAQAGTAGGVPATSEGAAEAPHDLAGDAAPSAALTALRAAVAAASVADGAPAASTSIKTNCPFRVTMRCYPDGLYRYTTVKLQHNHPLSTKLSAPSFRFSVSGAPQNATHEERFASLVSACNTLCEVASEVPVARDVVLQLLQTTTASARELQSKLAAASHTAASGNGDGDGDGDADRNDDDGDNDADGESEGSGAPPSPADAERPARRHHAADVAGGTSGDQEA